VAAPYIFVRCKKLAEATCGEHCIETAGLRPLVGATPGSPLAFEARAA
jgi:hypothetical protein